MKTELEIDQELDKLATQLQKENDEMKRQQYETKIDALIWVRGEEPQKAGKDQIALNKLVHLMLG